ncbi:hypothetical protein ACLKA6_008759 [Drosophila palustris]
MSHNSYYPSENFQYSPINNTATQQNGPHLETIYTLLLDIQKENRSLKAEVLELKKNQHEMKLSITKLIEEVVSGKLENRKLHCTTAQLQVIDDLPYFQQFPFTAINDMINFDEMVQKEDDQLNQFVEKDPPNLLELPLEKNFLTNWLLLKAGRGSVLNQAPESASSSQLLKIFAT